MLLSEVVQSEKKAKVTEKYSPLVIGMLTGEGIGPDLIHLCHQALDIIQSKVHVTFDIRYGGDIGILATAKSGHSLTDEVVEFTRNIFADKGAILAGPGGGRFVYEMRRKFELYVKMNPLHYFSELAEATRLKFPKDASLDILVVRENLGGLYQGEDAKPNDVGEVVCKFGYRIEDVEQILSVALRLAAIRRGKLTVVAKRGGIDAITKLWFETAERQVDGTEIELELLDMDYASYQFIANPEAFDVVAIPNCFGDILADLGGIFMGSRGNTYGGSYDLNGNGVYQTNHGSAHDLAGKNTANPAGQLFSLAMLLRHSFGLHDCAHALEESVRNVWRSGAMTHDLAQANGQILTTQEFGSKVLNELSLQL